MKKLRWMQEQEENQHRQAAQAIAQSLGLEAPENGDQALLAWLENRVDALLRHEPEKLMQALYRFDVDENQVRAAMHPAQAENPARQIAKLLMERQLQKLYWRQRFSSS